jgi:hypothetical protein
MGYLFVFHKKGSFKVHLNRAKTKLRELDKTSCITNQARVCNCNCNVSKNFIVGTDRQTDQQTDQRTKRVIEALARA